MKDIINYPIPESLVKENDLKVGDVISVSYDKIKNTLFINQIYKIQRPTLRVKGIELNIIVDQVS